MSLKDKLFRYFDFYKLDDNHILSIQDNWNLFNIFIENPFKTWWKARKYFKIPKTKVTFYFNKNLSTAKILDIVSSDLMWKDKWNSPRHEDNPHICICFFKKFGIQIIPRIYGTDEFGEKEEKDMHYWEYLLDYLYYSKTLKLTSCWTTSSDIFQHTVRYGENGSKDKKEPYYVPIYTHLFSLNKKGLKEFKKLYE